MSQPTALKDARLRIELNTQDAQARIDALVEAMEEISDDLDDREDKLKKEEKESTKLGKQRNEREGRVKPTMDNTGPGKFGLRQIPQLLGAAELAGAIPGVGGAARLATNLEQRYGALAEGLIEGTLDQLPLTPMVRAAIKATTTEMNQKLRKVLTEVDVRLKAIQPAIESAIEMSKAALVTGGHINAEQLRKFAVTAFEWDFVNARKERDIRDKTLKLIATQAPGALKDIFMQAVEGKFTP